MVTPEKLDAWVTHHFDTVTEEEFLRNLKRSLPPEEWAAINAQIARRRAPRGIVPRAREALRKLFHPLRPRPAGPARPE
jgi:hypothetical protein